MATSPTIGRIVHFRALGSASLEPALVVAVRSETTITLVVWAADGSARTEVDVLWGNDEGQWDWPTRPDVKLPPRG